MRGGGRPVLKRPADRAANRTRGRLRWALVGIALSLVVAAVLGAQPRVSDALTVPTVSIPAVTTPTVTVPKVSTSTVPTVTVPKLPTPTVPP